MIQRPEPRYPDVVFAGTSQTTVTPFLQRSRILPWAAGVVLLYAALTVVMTYPQIRVIDRGVSIDIGDPLLSTWRLAWIAHQLPRDPLHLYDANIFYPEPRTLAYSDAMLVPALTAAPLVWLGVHPLLASNLLLLSGFALSGAGMFLLVWSLTRHVPAALLAGFVFAFLPYRFMHYAHLELQMAQWMPMCLWALHRTIVRGRVGDGLLAGLFLALQTLSSWYTASSWRRISCRSRLRYWRARRVRRSCARSDRWRLAWRSPRCSSRRLRSRISRLGGRLESGR